LLHAYTFYIRYETSYDKFNKNAERIYRVNRTFYGSDGSETLHLSAVASPFGPLLKMAFPGIEKITRVLDNGATILHYKNKLFNEKRAYYVDENFPEIFDLKIIYGGKVGLKEPYNIMMTEKMAHKYFGKENPINKIIQLDNNKHEFYVIGIFQGFPENAHMHPDILMSFNTLKDSSVYGEKSLQSNWYNNSFYTYLLLSPNYNASQLNKQLPSFLDAYVHLPYLAGNVQTSKATKLELQKLTDIHLKSHSDDELEQNGDIQSIYLFSIIAIFIIFIACVNYMNLSTARSALRSKEIGIRKVIGAQRGELIKQFLSESIFITYISLLFSIFFAWLIIPYLNSFSDLDLSLKVLNTPPILLALMIMPFFLGFISGIYPAIFMASFIPVKVLKGITNLSAGNITIRKVLVVTQFSIAITLIIATTVVYQQLHYMQQKTLGFNKDHIVVLNYHNELNQRFNSFRADLLINPDVNDVGRSSRIPSSRLLDYLDSYLPSNGSMQPVKTDLKYLSVDDHFIPTYGIQIVAGRNFSKQYLTDSTAFLLNEAAVQALGLKNAANALGKDIKYGGVTGKIKGIVKDFHFESLRQKISPLLFRMLPDYNNISINMNGNNISSALSAIRETWHKYIPQIPFEYDFLDEKFKNLYNSEQQQGKLFTIFSCVAIFIACLGLLGLSAFTISQRIKEIGVRKILGATVLQIVVELSKDFLILVIIAGVVSFPLAWFCMNKWLLEFASRISISLWVFVCTLFAVVLISFVTISYQSIKAALANPIKSLRSE
jgi:putative ABC transport system permease protein